MYDNDENEIVEETPLDIEYRKLNEELEEISKQNGIIIAYRMQIEDELGKTTLEFKRKLLQEQLDNLNKKELAWDKEYDRLSKLVETFWDDRSEDDIEPEDNE